MELKNKFCKVDLTLYEGFAPDFADSRSYDIVLNPEMYRAGQYFSTMAIHIDLPDKALNIALIGEAPAYDTDCAVLEGGILTVIQYEYITQLRVTDGSVVLHKRLSCDCCSFGLYRIPKGYVVYGELEIMGLDLNFDKVWGFSSRDIFVSQSGKQAFELRGNSICLYDWDDNYYELDFDGKLICERAANG